MAQSWYYQRDGKTHGPVSSAEIKKLAGQGRLGAGDLLWAEGKSLAEATLAGAALSPEFFAGPTKSDSAPAGAVPDWLSDVAAAESKGPTPGPLPSEDVPQWLDDLRLWIGLDIYVPASQSAREKIGSEPSNASPSGGVPDWLESWMTPEKPKGAQQQLVPAAPNTIVAVTSPSVKPVDGARPTEPAVAQPVAVAPVPAVPLPATANPAGMARPAEPVVARPAVVVPVPAATIPASANPAATAPPAESAEARPAAVPPVPTATIPFTASSASMARAAEHVGAPPAAKAPAPEPRTPAAANPRTILVEKTLHASGFDLETGQILDAEKFRIWKQQQAASTSAGQLAVSNASLLEVFRKARTAIEAWVDDEINRSCVMQTAIEEIRRKPDIQTILREYGNYGKQMEEKLLRHLAFMVENRSKFYRALENAERHV